MIVIDFPRAARAAPEPIIDADFVEVPAKTPDIADVRALAAAVCPACGEPLTFQRCEGVCRSARCVFRVVLTCSDM